MTDTQHLRSLLGARLEIVQQIGRLNARQMRNQQIFGGLELEMMQCERDLSQSDDTRAAADRLEQVRAQRDATAAQLAEDDRELLDWHGRLDALDLQIDAH